VAARQTFAKKAKETLEEGKASDIYLDFGYNNLSNFSTAFKTNSKGQKKLINHTITLTSFKISVIIVLFLFL
jgi:methylphosphotriester-DNA--protein-cysteine methyltransferase